MEVNTNRVVLITYEREFVLLMSNGKINRRVTCTMRLKFQSKMKRVGGADSVHA